MSKGAQIVRYVLIAGSLLLAAADYVWPYADAAYDSVTGKILGSLAFGFFPALVGYVIAWIGRLIASREQFHRVWYTAWAIFLLTTAGGYYVGVFLPR